MDHNNELKIQIEQLRKKMYQAYEAKVDYAELLQISKKLDQLLNQLETQKIN